MGIFHPQKSIRTEIEKSSTYNCLLWIESNLSISIVKLISDTWLNPIYQIELEVTNS